MSGLDPMHVYIADDNEEFAEYVATAARREGWIAEVCGDGAQLIKSLESGSGSALVFVDINMPNMDGVETAGRIAFVNRPLRIRFITGGHDVHILAANLIARGRELSVGRNLYKPLPLATLKQVLADEQLALSEYKQCG